MHGAVGQIYLGRGSWDVKQVAEKERRVEERRIEPTFDHWIGWFWKCPWCGTNRIGRTPLMRWLAESVHKQYCAGRYKRREGR